MTEESGPYIYKGQQFSSREAMALFIASRAPAGGAARPAKAGKGFEWTLGKAMGVIAALVMVSWTANMLNRQPVVPVAKRPAPAGASDSSKATLAAMINLHGQLCATVTGVERIEGNVYRVSCVRFRDGSGVATYEVNAATAQVK